VKLALISDDDAYHTTDCTGVGFCLIGLLFMFTVGLLGGIIAGC